MPGSADLCFLTDQPLDEVVAELARQNVPVEEGPIERAGATGPINSANIRDPDGNLREATSSESPNTDAPYETRTTLRRPEDGVLLAVATSPRNSERLFGR